MAALSRVSPTFSGLHVCDMFTFNTNNDAQEVPHVWKFANTRGWKCCQSRKLKQAP